MRKHTQHTQAKQIVIVDPKVDDYSCLVDLADSGVIRWTMTSTGASSLRLVESHLDALWLIGVQLPDMSGLDLLEMLQSMAPRLTMFVVDGEYSSERECRALQLSAARYLCKPVHPEWIAGWRGLSKHLPVAAVEPPKSQIVNPGVGAYKPTR